MNKAPLAVLLLQNARDAESEVKVDLVLRSAPVSLHHARPARRHRRCMQLQVLVRNVRIGEVGANTVVVRAKAAARNDAHQIIIQYLVQVVKLVSCTRVVLEFEVGKVRPVLVVLQNLLLSGL